MLHACEILFSGFVRARILALPNKAKNGGLGEGMALFGYARKLARTNPEKRILHATAHPSTSLGLVWQRARILALEENLFRMKD